MPESKNPHIEHFVAPVDFVVTGFETPNSSIVTPYITSARAIVRLEWVTMMNCERSMKRSSTLTKRPMFDSSRGASSSSRTQKGLGLIM